MGNIVSAHAMLLFDEITSFSSHMIGSVQCYFPYYWLILKLLQPCLNVPVRKSDHTTVSNFWPFVWRNQISVWFSCLRRTEMRRGHCRFSAVVHRLFCHLLQGTKPGLCLYETLWDTVQTHRDGAQVIWPHALNIFSSSCSYFFHACGVAVSYRDKIEGILTLLLTTLAK